MALLKITQTLIINSQVSVFLTKVAYKIYKEFEPAFYVQVKIIFKF